MKKKQSVLPNLADRLELPEEALLGTAKLTVTAGRRALIENHRGILEYSPERIAVSLGAQQLSILGRELRIAAMNHRELLIRGELQDIEWG
ncbi:MAG: hypothetical protein IIU18_04660 [Oscillospiraceae bacterium]|nr:hypothetical protein [Oscillospiraceae bacterium]